MRNGSYDIKIDLFNVKMIDLTISKGWSNIISLK